MHTEEQSMYRQHRPPPAADGAPQLRGLATGMLEAIQGGKKLVSDSATPPSVMAAMSKADDAVANTKWGDRKFQRLVSESMLRRLSRVQVIAPEEAERLEARLSEVSEAGDTCLRTCRHTRLHMSAHMPARMFRQVSEAGDSPLAVLSELAPVIAQTEASADGAVADGTEQRDAIELAKALMSIEGDVALKGEIGAAFDNPTTAAAQLRARAASTASVGGALPTEQLEAARHGARPCLDMRVDMRTYLHGRHGDADARRSLVGAVVQSTADAPAMVQTLLDAGLTPTQVRWNVLWNVLWTFCGRFDGEFDGRFDGEFDGRFDGEFDGMVGGMFYGMFY